jgi:hypothetical protein
MPGAVKKLQQEQRGFKGVHRLQSGGQQYIACINYEEKPLLLGLFPAAKDAAQAYDRAALALEGVRAATNFPKAQYSFVEVMEMEEEVRELGRVLRGKDNGAEAAEATTTSSSNGGGPTYHGVHAVGGGSQTAKYIACIAKDSQKLLLGQYTTAEEAAKVYDQAVLAVSGIRAITNFPKAQYSFVEVAEMEQHVGELQELMQPGVELNGGRGTTEAAAEAAGVGDAEGVPGMDEAGVLACRETLQDHHEQQLGQQGPVAAGALVISRGPSGEGMGHDEDMVGASPEGMHQGEHGDGSWGEGVQEEGEEEAMDVDGTVATAGAAAQQERAGQPGRGGGGGSEGAAVAANSTGCSGGVSSLVSSRIPLSGRRSSEPSGAAVSASSAGAAATAVGLPGTRPPQLPPTSAALAAAAGASNGCGMYTRRAKQQGLSPAGGDAYGLTVGAAPGSGGKGASTGSKSGSAPGSKLKGVGQYGTDKTQGVYRAWVVVKGKGIHLGRHYTSEQEAVRDHDCAVLALGLKHEQMNHPASNYTREEVEKLAKLLKERGFKLGTVYVPSDPSPAAGGGGEAGAGKGEKRRASAPAAVLAAAADAVADKEEGLVEETRGKRRCLQEPGSVAPAAAELAGPVDGYGEREGEASGRLALPSSAAAAASSGDAVAVAGGSVMDGDSSGAAGRGSMTADDALPASTQWKGTASDAFLHAAAAGAAAGKAAAVARRGGGSEEGAAGGFGLRSQRRQSRGRTPVDDEVSGSEYSEDEGGGAAWGGAGTRYKGIRRFETKDGVVVFRPYIYGKVNGQKAFISLGGRDTELKAARLRDSGGYALFGETFQRFANFRREEYGDDDIREAGMELIEREAGLSALKKLNPQLAASLGVASSRADAGHGAAAAAGGGGGGGCAVSGAAGGGGGGSVHVQHKRQHETFGAGAKGAGMKRRQQDMQETEEDSEDEPGDVRAGRVHHGCKGPLPSNRYHQQQQKKPRLELETWQQQQQQEGQDNGEGTAAARPLSKVERGLSCPPASPAAAAKARAASMSPRKLQQQQTRRSLDSDVGGVGSAAQQQQQQQLGVSRRSLGFKAGASGTVTAASAAGCPGSWRSQKQRMEHNLVQQQQQQQSRRMRVPEVNAAGRSSASATAAAVGSQRCVVEQQQDAADADDGDDQDIPNKGYEKVLVAPGVYARCSKRDEGGSISYVPFLCGMGRLHVGTFKDKEEAIRARDLCMLVLAGPDCGATTNPASCYSLEEVQETAERLKGQPQAEKCLGRFRLEDYRGVCTDGSNDNTAAAAKGVGDPSS